MVRLSKRRFRSFSDAVDSVLEAVSETVPGIVMLARLEPDQQSHLVIGVCGQALGDLDHGTVLPSSGSEIDADFLQSLGAQSWLSAPLEMSDGRIVGALWAIDAEADAYGPGHATQLGVAAQLLSHNWENVELRSELRRLRSRVDTTPGTDPETGLADRESFLEMLDREWRQAGTSEADESILFLCRVGGAAAQNGDGTGDATASLALKVSAEVLAGSIRDTDRVGRIDERGLAVLLVGCQLRDAPQLVARFLRALERVTENGQPEVEIACGLQALPGTSSPEEALELAESSVGEPMRVGASDVAPEEAPK